MGPFRINAIVTDRDDSIRNATKAVWPNAYQLLCTWHILENLRRKVTPPFKRLAGGRKDPDGIPMWKIEVAKFELEWRRLVIDATTETSLEDGIRCLRTSYSGPAYRGLLEDALDEAEHIYDTCRNQICRVYTDRIRHLGQRSNSRLEGLHSVLKNSIGSRAARRKASLVIAATGILQHMDEQWEDIIARMARQAESSTSTHHVIFRPLRRSVSDYAIGLMQSQLGRALNAGDGVDLPPCTGFFEKSLGLLCAHRLKPILDNDTCVTPSDIYGHWYLNTRDEMEGYRTTLNDTLENHTLEKPAEIDFSLLAASSNIILDPVRVSRRKADAAEIAARARRLDGTETEEPGTLDTGRIATQTERDAGARHPSERICPSCGSRHAQAHVCSDRRMENFSSQQSTINPSQISQMSSMSQMSNTPPPMFSQMSNTPPPTTLSSGSTPLSDDLLRCPVLQCPFCSKPHRRKGCKGLADWRRDRITHKKRLEVLQLQRTWRDGSHEASSDEEETDIVDDSSTCVSTGGDRLSAGSTSTNSQPSQTSQTSQ